VAAAAAVVDGAVTVAAGKEQEDKDNNIKKQAATEEVKDKPAAVTSIPESEGMNGGLALSSALLCPLIKTAFCLLLSDAEFAAFWSGEKDAKGEAGAGAAQAAEEGQWKVLAADSEYVMVWAMNTPYPSYDMYAAPYAHMSE
jgi:hypothetical protein